VPNAQSITDEPATTAWVAVVSGLGGSRRICAPASTLIAEAPIKTQYPGVSAAGRTGKASRAAVTRPATSRYPITPTAQQATATATRPPGQGGGSEVRPTATDCVATGRPDVSLNDTSGRGRAPRVPPPRGPAGQPVSPSAGQQPS
jgi:hypothetical protein